MDYFLDNRLVFSDINDGARRTRTSFNLAGKIEGQRTDSLKDGSSSSTFENDFGTTYNIQRNARGITVLEKDGDSWVRVNDSNKCSELLEQERRLFSAPRVLSQA